MLIKLTIENFQKHEFLDLDFTAGLQVIRGANEAGKSTIFRAVAYAWWGSRALPESLDETVTDGKLPSSLKVTLVFTHGNVTYTIVRKKSGATLTASDGVTAAGQAEVTSFMERLFGATADVAKSTLLTSQKSLEDGLDSSAMTLIEKLANMQVIDQYIQKVQDRLPSGNTRLLESQIATAEVPKPVLDTAEAQKALQMEQGTVAELKAEIETLLPDLEATTALAESASAKSKSNLTATRAKAQLDRAIADCVMQPLPTVSSSVEELEAKAAEQALQKSLAWAHGQLLTLQGYASPLLPLPVEEVNLKVAEVKSQISAARKAALDASNGIVVLQTLRITETVCGLCDKDLSAVPEVLTKNSENAAKAEALKLEATKHEEKLLELKAELSNYEAALDVDKALVRALPIEHVEVDTSTTPRILKWVGPEIAVEVDTTDWAAALKKVKAEEVVLQAAVNHNARVEGALLSYKAQLEALTFSELTDEEAYAVASLPELATRYDSRKTDLTNAQGRVSQLQRTIESATLVHETQLANWKASQVKRKELLELLATTHKHNTLIGKLRDARPVVARELWALVLSGVSHYFSTIRGQPSVVTRSTEGFLIDGKGVKRYSGSTKDTLGISNRLMLQKTFLPNVSLMLIDEPGAAFDSGREATLLGVLSSLGIEQVIVVTHSDIADSFAANVIQI